MVKKKQTAPKTQTPVRVLTTIDDVKSAALVVSVIINLAIFIAWVVLRVTTKYDEQVFNFLFTR